MSNIMSFIKEKSYYFLGGTVLLLIIIIAIGSCSNKSNTYESIEEKMVSAAKEYYSTREKSLPKTDGGSVRVSISSLIDAELIDEIIDPNDSSNHCKGYVEVTKVGKDYSYLPFLTCKGNYEPKYLNEKLKETKLDEYGNGLYEMEGEYVFRGDDVKNYVSFNNQIWRIVKIDSEGDIKLVLAEPLEDTYPWDTAYNTEKESDVGITTDYLHASIRKTLVDYYKTNFSKDSKAKIVKKDLCVGRYSISNAFSKDVECAVKEEKEKIGLLVASDVKNASLSEGCKTLGNYECSNYNYLSNDSFKTWLLTASSDTTYRAFQLYSTIDESTASNDKRIAPVVYITGKAVTNAGNGTIKKPFIIK